MWTSKAKAVARFRELTDLNPRVRRKLGDSVAEATLDHNDGIISKPNKGHFDFFEYLNPPKPLAAKFQIVESL